MIGEKEKEGKKRGRTEVLSISIEKKEWKMRNSLLSGRECIGISQVSRSSKRYTGKKILVRSARRGGGDLKNIKCGNGNLSNYCSSMGIVAEGEGRSALTKPGGPWRGDYLYRRRYERLFVP